MILQYPLPTYPRNYSAAFSGTPPEAIDDALETWRRQLSREELNCPLEGWARRYFGLRLEDLDRLISHSFDWEIFADVEVRTRQKLARVTGVRELAETAVTIVSTSDRGNFDLSIVPAPTWSGEYRSGPIISSAHLGRPPQRKALAPPKRD